MNDSIGRRRRSSRRWDWHRPRRLRMPASGSSVPVFIRSSRSPATTHSLEVEDQIGLTFSATYMFAPNWGVELLAALPFTHDITLNGAGAVGEIDLLPPTLSAQYHFNPNGRVRPYVGAGLNYTIFSDERTWGALQGTKLELDPSFGPAAQLGVDIDVIPGWIVNLDVRWFDIDTDAKLDGADLGTMEIDPYAFGLSLGHRF